MTLNRRIVLCRCLVLAFAAITLSLAAVDIRVYHKLYPNGMCLDFVPEQAFYQSCLSLSAAD